MPFKTFYNPWLFHHQQLQKASVLPQYVKYVLFLYILYLKVPWHDILQSFFLRIRGKLLVTHCGCNSFMSWDLFIYRISATNTDGCIYQFLFTGSIVHLNHVFFIFLTLMLAFWLIFHRWMCVQMRVCVKLWKLYYANCYLIFFRELPQ